MSQSRHKPSAREVALDVLTKVEQERSYSNLLLNQTLQKHQLAREEASFATELVYGTIQRLNTIDYFLERFVSRGMSKLQPWVRSLLRLSFYQLYYLDRIPPYAAVGEAVNLAKRRGHQGISGMVNGVLRNVLRATDELEIPASLDPVKGIALAHSHPEWMVARYIEQYGEEETRAICASNNEPPHVSVRVNRRLISRDEMMNKMADAGHQVRGSLLSSDGIVVESGGNMAFTDWYRAGLISIQDESSMLVAAAVNPQPGMKVLDCCAAPGGKTAHMAEMMDDQGMILANDVHPHKQKLIAEQADRLQLRSIRTMVSDAALLTQRLEDASFDRVLLDAPCSGLGVIRRKPDLKWTKASEEIAEIIVLQRQLLAEAGRLLRPGGILVYSTCTIEQGENERQISRFLKENPSFIPADESTENEAWRSAIRRTGPHPAGAGMMRILPHQFHSDGFFIARMQKQM